MTPPAPAAPSDGPGEVLFSPGSLGCTISTKGILSTVRANGQAARLGLRVGDAVTHVNGHPFIEVNSPTQTRSIEAIKQFREPFTVRLKRVPAPMQDMASYLMGAPEAFCTHDFRAHDYAHTIH